MECPNHAFTRGELVEKALGYEYEGLNRTMDSHIKNLRRKIEPDPLNLIYWGRWAPIKDTARITEVGEVARAFNDMANSLQQAETLRRNLMADVAHELRTPLTVMQGLLGVFLDGAHPLELKEIAILYDETCLLARLVEDVCELALAEAKQLSFTLQAVDAESLLRAEVTFANAAYWCLHPAGCQDVLIQGVRILNSPSRNCDGIDIDHCRNVRISNCHIESVDDCICIKNRRDYAEYGSCENITIMSCILASTSCALKLGSENMDAMRNIIVAACVINASNRGLGIQNRDEGAIEDVLFSNIIVESRLFADVWWGKAEPIYITAFKRAPGTPYRFPNGKAEGTVGKMRNIRFHNILCRSENGVYIGGCSDSRIEEVLLENVRVEVNKTTDYLGGMYDRRPCDAEGIIHQKTAGFFIHDADDIVLRNCRVVWGPNRPAYYGRAIEAQRVTGLEVENFKGSAAHPHKSVAIQVTPPDALCSVGK